MLNHHRQKITT